MSDPTIPAERSLVMRDDTMLGVCEALGQEFRFNPLWLRIALAVLLMVKPVAVIAAYLAAGLVVAAARRLYPLPKAPARPAAAVPQAQNDEAPAVLAEAA